jgi:hypothetical protein
MSDIDLGKNLCTKKQLDEFVAFQDSQSTRRVYLAEIAELAFSGWNKHREWVFPTEDVGLFLRLS